MNSLLLAMLLLAGPVPPDSALSSIQVTKGNFIKRITLSGELQAVEQVNVSAPRVSRSPNLVISYLAPEGSVVQPGDVVAQFDISELETEKLSLEKEREDARIEIAKKEAEIETRRQDLLLSLANAEKVRNVAQLYAQIDPALIPRADAEKYAFDLSNSRLEIEKATERLNTLEQNRESEMEIVRLRYQQADLKLKRLESELAKMVVRAPIAGLVIYGDANTRAGKIQVGDSLWSGWPVILLPNMESLQIDAFTYDTDVPFLEVGEAAEIILDAVPGRAFRAEVTSVSEIATSRTFRSLLKTFRTKVRLLETDLSVMKPGMTARVHILKTLPEALVVPRAAIRLGSDGRTSVLKNGSVPEWIEVEVLDANSESVAVQGPLQPGDHLLPPSLDGETLAPSLADDWIKVERQDLKFTVPGNGTIEAEEAVAIGPPNVTDMWRFKIVHLAPEGLQVQKGHVLVGFDPSEIHKRMREEQANLSKVEEELERARASQQLELKDLELQLEEARAQEERARNKLLQAREFESNLKVQEAEYEAALSIQRVGMLEKKLASVRTNLELELQILEDRRTLHSHRIENNQKLIDSMMIKAPISGVVIYDTNWRNEKKQVGSDVFRMEKVLSLPNLDTLVIKGQVSEVDAGKIGLGQVVEITLDAVPDRTFYGKIRKIDTIFTNASQNRPFKVLGFVAELDHADPELMRPGMVAKLQIVTERFQNSLAVPLSAIQILEDRSLVRVKNGEDSEVREVTLGKDNGVVAVIASGLSEGAEISARPQRVLQ